MVILQSQTSRMACCTNGGVVSVQTLASSIRPVALGHPPMPCSPHVCTR